MRSLLNNHSDIKLAGETHFFDDMRLRIPCGKRLASLERESCEDYFLALSHRPYGHKGDSEQSGIQRGKLRAFANTLGGTSDAYFEAYCRLWARREGATRWGEKTPRHIFRVGDIFKAYPAAKVICMVRDPRAVVASYRDWRYTGGFDLEADPEHEAALAEDYKRVSRSYNILIATMIWRASVAAAYKAAAQFGAERVRIQAYEALVDDPCGTVKSITAWVGVNFEPAMMEVPLLNSSVTEFRAAAGVTKEAVDRWRSRLSAREIGLIQRCAGGLMHSAGYKAESVSISRAVYVVEWGKLPVAILRACFANRSRVPNFRSYLWRRLVLATTRS